MARPSSPEGLDLTLRIGYPVGMRLRFAAPIAALALMGTLSACGEPTPPTRIGPIAMMPSVTDAYLARACGNEELVSVAIVGHLSVNAAVGACAPRERPFTNVLADGGAKAATDACPAGTGVIGIAVAGRLSWNASVVTCAPDAHSNTVHQVDGGVDALASACDGDTTPVSVDVVGMVSWNSTAVVCGTDHTVGIPERVRAHEIDGDGQTISTTCSRPPVSMAVAGQLDVNRLVVLCGHGRTRMGYLGRFVKVDAVDDVARACPRGETAVNVEAWGRLSVNGVLVRCARPA